MIALQELLEAPVRFAMVEQVEDLAREEPLALALMLPEEAADALIFFKHYNLVSAARELLSTCKSCRS